VSEILLDFSTIPVSSSSVTGNFCHSLLNPQTFAKRNFAKSELIFAFRRNEKGGFHFNPSSAEHSKFIHSHTREKEVMNSKEES
jgi:hypothetical protein